MLDSVYLDVDFSVRGREIVARPTASVPDAILISIARGALINCSLQNIAPSSMMIVEAMGFPTNKE